MSQYIKHNFEMIFPAHVITIDYRDDETIHVDVRLDNVRNAQFVMHVTSDDDEYRFDDVDHNFPSIVFPIDE